MRDHPTSCCRFDSSWCSRTQATTSMAAPRSVVQRPAIVDTRTLEPGVLIEVLDAAGLWFPARVLAVSPAGVNVHFLGWSKAWDDFVPTNKYATNLCQFRGWGETIPGDYRVGERIEALDLTGVWLTCRVLAVAEALVKVHYFGWPSKWDEWIHRSAGRLQRIAPNEGAVGNGEGASGINEIAARQRMSAKRSGERKARAHDLNLNEEICSVCHTVGQLVCCEGKCLRSFHLECVEPLLAEVGARPLVPERPAPASSGPIRYPPLEPVSDAERIPQASATCLGRQAHVGGAGPLLGGAQKSALCTVQTDACGGNGAARGKGQGHAVEDTESTPWVCPDCSQNVCRCVLCGEVEHESEPLELPFRCMSKRRCGRAFHPSCLASAWAQFGPACPASEAACSRGECPAHVCCECGEAEDGRYGNAMAVCFGCGCGLHRSCIPAGSTNFFSSTLGHGLCAECDTAREAASVARVRARGKGRGKQPLYSEGERVRGLVPFRFAPLPLLASDESSDDEDGLRRRGAHRRDGELSNLELRDAMQRSSDIGFPWRPLRFRKRQPQPFELPSEILSELSEGRCDATSGFRPPSYSLISRSIWRAARTEANERVELEPCVCHESGLRCAEGCLNRYTRHECSAATCAVGEELCRNRRIQKAQFPPLNVFKTLSKVHSASRVRRAGHRRTLCEHSCTAGARELSAESPLWCRVASSLRSRALAHCALVTHHAPRPRPHAPPTTPFPPRCPPQGWGVRATCPIASGEIVIEYVGEVIDKEEWEARNAKASQHEAIYFMHLSSNLIIDAAHKGNISRFINHSCSPNLQARRAMPSPSRFPAAASRELPALAQLRSPPF